MHSVYNLEVQIRDKLNRIKRTSHVGIYSTVEELEAAKLKILNETPNATFEVYTCEHILFKQQSN